MTSTQYGAGTRPSPLSRFSVVLAWFALILFACLSAGAAPAKDTPYQEDMRFALEELEKQCGHFFKLKEIDWKKVSKEFLKESGKVKTDPEHLVLLTRLLARIKDGHAAVQPLEKGKDVKWPEEDTVRKRGPGMFLCKVGKKIYVKNSWSATADAGIEPGMEVVKIEDKPALKWLEARQEKLCDLYSFSTEQQAFFFTCHWGLSEPTGTLLELELKTLKKKKKKRTLTYRNASPTPSGPAYFPEGINSTEDLNYTKTKNGYGYIHVRRSPGDLPEQMDQALAAVGDVPGLILDFRGNSGGGFDHDGFMGRFVPEGRTLSFAKSYASAGPNPYGGPIVVIIDATVRSAGETGSGIFKEDGRAFMIGESATAGMSSQKTTIELPSRLFGLYVSIRSNKSRFNKGRGIEGIGVIPHEYVEFDPKDLGAKEDTLIKRAEALLKKFPQKEVSFKAE